MDKKWIFFFFPKWLSYKWNKYTKQIYKKIKNKNEKNSKFIIGRVANRLTNDFFLSKDYKNFIMFLFYFFGETTLLWDSYYSVPNTRKYSQAHF